jgi:hypothetical protein
VSLASRPPLFDTAVVCGGDWSCTSTRSEEGGGHLCVGVEMEGSEAAS